jgi:hypothetical protein
MLRFLPPLLDDPPTARRVRATLSIVSLPMTPHAGYRYAH